jgi:hypothetical protein
MVVLVIVTVVCFIAGVAASTRWLPPLSDGPVGGIAYFIVCGLAGATLATVGINVDSTVRALERSSEGSGELESIIVSDGLLGICRDAGMLAGLALIAYLLAPKAPRESTITRGPSAEPSDATSSL